MTSALDDVLARVPGRDGRVLDWFARAGFAELERREDELVFGTLEPMDRRAPDPPVAPCVRSTDPAT